MWVFSGPSVQCQEMCLSVSRRFPGHPMTETEDDRELFNPACRGHPMTETEDDWELLNPACRGHPMTETEDDEELVIKPCLQVWHIGRACPSHNCISLLVCSLCFCIILILII